jgi:hypothetical protein
MVQDDLSDEISQVTQQALKMGKDPKQDVQKILSKKSMEAQVTGDSDKAAKVAGAASKINPDPNAKKMQMKKK